MSTTSNHIINKQVFEFTCPKFEDAFEMQKQMDSGLQYKIQTGIEKILNENSKLNEIVRIDKLEIELGQIPFKKLSEILPLRFHEKFTEKIVQQIPVEKKPVVLVSNETKNTTELLEIFLFSGSLPWWAGDANNFSLNDTLRTFIKNNPSALKIFLSSHIYDDEFVARLLHQTDTAIIEELIDLLEIRQQFLFIEKIITELYNYPRIENTESLVPQKKLHKQYDAPQIFFLGFEKNIFNIIISLITSYNPAFTEEQKKLLLKEKISDVFENLIDENHISTILKSLEVKDFYFELETLKNEIVCDEQLKNPLSDKISLPQSGEKIFIQNAGLVLIAVFLPSLFKELQWINEDKFITRECRLKALFLLHYLCMGETEAPEYTLQLNKILCGIDITEPIPYSIQLSDYEKQEANQLLKDILFHWSALKNSSVQGLQGSFLLRDGLLSFNNNRWLLQVERKGYDILLDQVAWSWKLIKFPWMKNYIDSEW